MSVQLQQTIHRRLNDTFTTWNNFWGIYFDEVNYSNYKQVNLKTLILMNRPQSMIDFTECFRSLTETIIKFINIDRNPFINDNNEFLNSIMDNFSHNINTTIDFEQYEKDLGNPLTFTKLLINADNLLLLRRDTTTKIINYIIDDKYKLKDYILRYLGDNIRLPIVIKNLKLITLNKNPYSFDVVKELVKNGILTFNQKLFEYLAGNPNQEAVDLIINNLRTIENPFGKIINTPTLFIYLAENPNPRMAVFFGQLYRNGNIDNIFGDNELLHKLLANENYYSILEELNIIHNSIKHLSDYSLQVHNIFNLALNKADGAVIQVIPKLFVLSDICKRSTLMYNLSLNTNDIAVKTFISYSKQGVLNTQDERLWGLPGNNNPLALDYVFEILNGPNINYYTDTDTELFWDAISSNSDDRAVDYILLNIMNDTLNHDIFNNVFETLNVLFGNKNERLMDYLRVHFLDIQNNRDNIINMTTHGLDLSLLFKNENIFELDTQDRINKTAQIETLIKNINLQLSNC